MVHWVCWIHKQSAPLQHASEAYLCLLMLQASGVKPGSLDGSPVSGARATGQSSGSGPASTSGRPAASTEEEVSLLGRITAPFKELAMRGTVYTSFVFAKQPKRIRQARGPACKCDLSARCCESRASEPLLWAAQGRPAGQSQACSTSLEV